MIFFFSVTDIIKVFVNEKRSFKPTEVDDELAFFPVVDA